MAEFDTQLLLLGVQGLDLKRAIDRIPPEKLARMTNLVRTEEGSLTARAGLTSLATTIDTSVHSLLRLNDTVPPTGFLRLVGAGTNLYSGQLGALTNIESGFSGDPLTFALYHPPLSADSWGIVGDSAKMRKVRASDSLDLPLGLAPPPLSDAGFRIDEFSSMPTSATGQLIGSRERTRFTSFGFDIVTNQLAGGSPGKLTQYGALQTTTIDTCELAAWTNNAGVGAAGTNVQSSDRKAGTFSTQFTTNKGAAKGNYYNFWSKAINLNLNNVGSVISTDDDIIHLWLKTDTPAQLAEIRIYFVCSGPFSTTILPGTDTATPAVNNTDAYVLAFTPTDFTALYETTTTSTGASGAANVNFQIIDSLPSIKDDRGSLALLKQTTNPKLAKVKYLSPGRSQWTEFGVLGLPLKKNEFRRIGVNSAASWGTVTGIVIVALVARPVNLNIWLDDVYLRGGYGPDTSLVGLTPYDYRYIHYDPRTGAKSNGSPIQGAGFRLDAVRQSITITPKAYGDSAIRQWFFRRGGSLPSNWYYVGQNTSDGGLYTDTSGDTDIVVAGTLETDNDQPVTTVGIDGKTILAQPLPSIWGPVNDIMFGCGDPYRPGVAYWCKPNMVDSWPTASNVEVCSPSEELMAGCVFGGQGFVFSRERLYILYPNLGNSGIVTTTPTSCNHGLVSRWSFTVGLGGIYFVARDGIYFTLGGPEQTLTDNDIQGIFRGETRNGYVPVDFTQPNAIRLEIFLNDLWFMYRGTDARNHILVYSIIFQFWRAVEFGIEPQVFYQEDSVSPASFLVGTRATGTVYSHTGTSDDGQAITANARTGALDQGSPRDDKRYGDITVDVNPAGASIVVTPLINNETTSLPAQTLTVASVRDRYYASLPQDQQARNISVDLSWSTTGTSPTLYFAGPSWIIQPDTTENRTTDWDAQGRLSDKFVKGVMLECDTGGLSKNINVQADGATITTFSVSASGRQVLQFSFPQFRGRVLRLAPADSVRWKLYEYRWIFDEEPLALGRWETQEIDHGIGDWQIPLYAHVALKSSAAVTLTLTSYNQSGLATSRDYTIASTAGIKQKTFVPFAAQKGVLFKYLFTSTQGFWLYKEETEVAIQPWGAPQATIVHPFGNDDLDGVIGLRDAGLAMRYSGGGTR